MTILIVIFLTLATTAFLLLPVTAHHWLLRCGKCERCGSKVERVYYCKLCRRTLCDFCFQTHGDPRATFPKP